MISEVTWSLDLNESQQEMERDGTASECFYDFWEIHSYHIAQSVKNLPAMQETQVRFLGQEDPLEKEMATQSSTLAWSLVGYSPWGHKESDMTVRLCSVQFC